LEVPGNLLMAGTYRLVLHASMYGVEDYLGKADIQQEITITAPGNFNLAHPGEPFDSVIMIDQGWQLRRKEENHEHHTDIRLAAGGHSPSVA